MSGSNSENVWPGCAGSCSDTGSPSMQMFDWLSGLEPVSHAGDPGVAEVQFKGRRTGLFRTGEQRGLQLGDPVVVEADRGNDLGFILLLGELMRLRLADRTDISVAELPKIVRHADEGDLEKLRYNREMEVEAFSIGRERVKKFGLPMKIIDAEWQFDCNKITLYFTAERRVDFRMLVRDLAGEFRTRVELRQIGARDESARIGGIGSCGRELCCSSCLTEFQPVAMHAAKVQDLPLNPQRLSGQCGRLKCCLNYELSAYMKALKHLPRAGKMIETPRGKGQVHKLDIFRSVAWVRFSDGSVECFSSDQLGSVS